MKRIFLLVLCLLAESAIASDVNGRWIVETEGPYGRTMDASFEQKNEKIIVHAVDAMGTRDGEGVIKGNKITWYVKIAIPGNEQRITFTGIVEGDSMHGTATLMGMTRVKWSGKRAVSD